MFYLYFMLIIFFTNYINIFGNSELTKSSVSDCPSLVDVENLTETKLLERLIHQCRYDRHERPVSLSENGTRQPVHVYVGVKIYFLHVLHEHNFQIKIRGKLQMKYVDQRLVLPKRKEILISKILPETIWLPELFFLYDEQPKTIDTMDHRLISISPEGTVTITYGIELIMDCLVNLQLFPLDEQHCSIMLETRMYNTSELLVHWEQRLPVILKSKLHFNNYDLLYMTTNETIVNADVNYFMYRDLAGNFSTLKFNVHMVRQFIPYSLTFFLPLMIIVSISWISFWLQVDQLAPRVLVGTSTMITSITLELKIRDNLPKFNCINISDIWFLCCITFILFSLIELAFVHTIWRRKKFVKLTKVTTKSIFKSIFISSTDETNLKIVENLSTDCIIITPQQISIWIDGKSRYLFPLIFGVFNAFFWTILYFI